MKNTSLLKKVAAATVLLGAVPMIVLASRAQPVQYVITQDEVHEGNAYGAGEEVLVAGRVTGDLTAAGGALLLTGTIDQDATIAGGQVRVFGPVHGDVRSVSGDIMISASVDGDVSLAGGQIYIAADSSIGGWVLAAGGQVRIDGAVTGDVDVAGGMVILNGPIHGSVTARGGQLKIESGAVIDGAVNFRGDQAPIIAEGAFIRGGVEHSLYNRSHAGDVRGVLQGIAIVATTTWILMNVVMALALFGLFRRKSVELTEAAAKNFWLHAGRGFAGIVLFPIASVLLLMSVVGVPIGIFGLLTFGLLMLIAMPLSGALFGTLFTRLVLRRANYQPNLGTAVWGVIALRLVALIPVVGWLICAIICCASFGVLLHAAHQQFWGKRHA